MDRHLKTKRLRIDGRAPRKGVSGMVYTIVDRPTPQQIADSLMRGRSGMYQHIACPDCGLFMLCNYVPWSLGNLYCWSICLHPACEYGEKRPF